MSDVVAGIDVEFDTNNVRLKKILRWDSQMIVIRSVTAGNGSKF